MAGPLTLDPLTHRANGKRAHVSGRLLCCHDEVRPVKVEGQATEADVDRHDEDRWEVQMLEAEVDARNEGKTSGRQMTRRQHYWKTIQKAMKHTQIPCERWHSEWRNVAPKKVDVQTKREATARCEGTGLQ